MKRLYGIAWLICLMCYVNAQTFTGIRGSRYAGITNVSFNPAIAGSPFLADVNLLSAGVAVNNNYLGVDRRALLHPSYFRNPDFFKLYTAERVNGKYKQGYSSVQIQGPLSLMYSFGNKKYRNRNAVAFSYHANVLMNTDNFSEVFARTLYHGLGAESNSVINYANRDLNNLNLSLKGAAWMDYGITYSRVIYDKGDNVITGGATLKLLQPLAGAYGYVDEFNYQWTEYSKLTINDSEAGYAYSNNLNQLGTHSAADGIRNLMRSNAGKITAGADVGVTYQWWPDRGRNQEMDCQCENFSDDKRYKLAVGFSVVDIGALRNKRSPLSRDFYADIRDWEVADARFPDGLQSLSDTLNSRFQIRNSDRFFTVVLPTRFNFYVDYNVYKAWGVAFVASVSPNMSPTQRMLHHVTTFTLTPRYDHKWLGFYLPVSYDVYGNISLGTSLRLGPLTIGTQDLLGLFAKKFVYNAEVHAALKVTMPYFKKCSKKDLRFEKKS